MGWRARVWRRWRRQPFLFWAIAFSLAGGLGCGLALISLAQNVAASAESGLPRRTVAVWAVPHSGGRLAVSGADLAAWRRGTTAFVGLAAFIAGRRARIGTPGGSARLRGAGATANLFPLLAARVLRGALPKPAAPGAPASLILSYTAWREFFAAAPDGGIGMAVRIDDGSRARPAVVRAVLAPGFRFPYPLQHRAPAFWTVLSAPNAGGPRGARDLGVVGVVRPGFTLGQARAQLATVAARLGRKHAADRDVGVSVVPIGVAAAGPAARWTEVGLGALALVILVVCLNLGLLLTADLEARRREAAVRQALGATAWRLWWEHWTATAAAALAGAAGAAAVGAWLLGALPRLLAALGLWLPLAGRPRLDWAALALTALLALALAALIAVASARVSPAHAMAVRSAATPAGWLIAGQLAAALVLLAAAGALAGRAARLAAAGLGPHPNRLLIAPVRLPNGPYREPPARRVFWRGFLGRVGGLPGVRCRAGADEFPDFPEPWPARLTPGYGPWRAAAFPQTVTRGYFSCVGIPLLRGREFSSLDGPQSPEVAVINSAMAARFWPRGGAVGSRIELAHLGTRRVVGIVGDAGPYATGLDAGVWRLAAGREPAIYLPFAQSPPVNMTVLARTAAPPSAFAPALRALLRRRAPDGWLARPVASLAQMWARSNRRMGQFLWLLGLLAIFAAAVALLGVHAAMALLAARRRRELAIRAALGARGRALAWAMGRPLGRVAGIGLTLGTVATFAGSSVIAGWAGASPARHPAFAALAVAALAAATLGAGAPALLRAVRRDPATDLREE